MVPDDFVQVVFGVVKGEAEAGLCLVDVHGRELHDVFMAKFTQQQDLPDRCGGQAITLLCGFWGSSGREGAGMTGKKRQEGREGGGAAEVRERDGGCKVPRTAAAAAAVAAFGSWLCVCIGWWPVDSCDQKANCVQCLIKPSSSLDAGQNPARTLPVLNFLMANSCFLSCLAVARYTTP